MYPRLLGLAALAALLAGASGIEARQRALPADQIGAGEPKTFTTTISGARGGYTIEHGGTMDGENSRYPLGVLPPPQAFESNLSVTIENVGETDVVNPWLSNHRTTFRSSAELVASVIRPGMTDEEKALAIWWKAMSLRFHGDAHEEEDSPMRVLHGYGFNTCGGMTAILMQLWRHAGLQSRMNVLPFHVVGEVKYAGAWHVLDGDLAGQYFLHDNDTVASFYQLGRDYDLIRRGHTYGMLEEVRGERVGSTPPLYSLGRLFTIRGRHLSHDDLHLNSWVKSFDKTRRYRGVSLDDARVMDMTLRPGERLTYRWESARSDRVLGADMSGEGAAAVALVTNGLWEYRPRLSSERWRAGAERSEGLRVDDGRLVAAAAAPGEIVWRVRSPYLFVGGTVTAAFEHARWAFSVDGRDWQPLGAGLQLDAALAALQTPTRWFLIRATVDANGWIQEPAITASFQAARVALPGMTLGPNRFTFSQQSTGDVRITHKWIERSFNAPPAAVSTVYPKDGRTIPAAALALRWAAPRDRDGDAMSDYHVQVSRFADMRWPLSPTFDRVMSKVGTLDGSATTFQFARTGLLNPDTDYYWRVRARDAAGLWGAWSKPSKFRVRGPRAPEAAEVTADAAARTGKLTWQANKQGRRPVRYEVHGSNEEGFSPDVSTLMLETDQTSVPVLGNLPKGNYAFYRVIAIDRDGSRGPSTPLVAAPRPFIYTRPVTALRAGAPFRYEPRSVMSLGSARKYDSESTSFWDRDDIVWKIVKGPAWLRLQDGVLQGEPEPGRYPVVLRAWSDIAGVDEQSFVIEAGDAAKEWPPAPVENAEPVCAEGITGAVSALYDAVAGGDPQTLHAMIHPDLLARIGRADASEPYLLDALADYQERMSEFGKPRAIEVVPLTCTDTRVDLIALLDYPKVERVLRERITVVRSDTGWLLGRAR